MKNLLYAILIISGLATCKKDKTGPSSQTTKSNPPTVNAPAIGTNSFTVSTCKFSNAAVVHPATYKYTPWAKYVTSTCISINYTDTAQAALPSITFYTSLNGLGIDTNANATMQFGADALCNYYGSVSPKPTDIQYTSDYYTYKRTTVVNITRYDTVGGLVEGTFKFKMMDYYAYMNGLHPGDTLNVSGKFSVKRLL